MAKTKRPKHDNIRDTDAERAARSRRIRMAGGGVRIDIVVTSPKVIEKLERLVALHGSRRAAVEAAILSI